MVGKVELIFACALHTISIFFYLLIFNVRPPSCATQTFQCAWTDLVLFVTCLPSATGTQFHHDDPAAGRRVAGLDGNILMPAGVRVRVWEQHFATCTRPSSSSSSFTRAAPPSPYHALASCHVENLLRSTRVCTKVESTKRRAQLQTRCIHSIYPYTHVCVCVYCVCTHITQTVCSIAHTSDMPACRAAATY